MDHPAEPNQPDPALRFQREMYYQLVHTLCGMLPAPADHSRAEHARRYRVAIGQVAAVAPANADEADIAAHYVAAGAHASDCLVLAVYNENYPRAATKLKAQAASMMREARGYRSLLMRVQAARHKREAKDETREQDSWTQHCALGLMTQALQDLAPAPRVAPPPPPAPPPAPPAAAPAAIENVDLDPADAAEDEADTQPSPIDLLALVRSLPRLRDYDAMVAMVREGTVPSARSLWRAPDTPADVTP